MNKELLAYAAKIKAEKSGYSVSFRDLKNVFTEGENLEEVVINARDVLDILLLDMVNDDFNIPKPTPCKKDEVLISVSPEVAAPALLHQLRV